MKPEIRIASLGNVDSGKSTTIAVLSNNIRDNGSGSARKLILKHDHEKLSGNTSTITPYFVERDDKITCFIDLAGHESYLKTTLSGLNGNFIDYAMITIGTEKGITRITKEHLGVAILLRIPIFIVLTKMDTCLDHKLEKIEIMLNQICSHTLLKNKQLVIASNTNIDDILVDSNTNQNIIPLFKISNKTGDNLDILNKFVYNLSKSRNITQDFNNLSCFCIENKYKIKGVGIVVSGTMSHGIIRIDDTLYLGPCYGQYKEVVVKSIHDNFYRNVDKLEKGQGGCIHFKFLDKKFTPDLKKHIHRGQVITNNAVCYKKFKAEVTILHHPTTISIGYCPVIHCNSVRQCVKIIGMEKEVLRTGDKCIVEFEFVYSKVYIEVGALIVFREGNTKGIGRITEIIE